MKLLYTLAICSLVFFSCKKETSHRANIFLENVKSSLKDSLSNTDYSSLDFSKAVVNRVDSVGLYFLRVPFKGRMLRSDFVLVKTGESGKVIMGKIIHLEGTEKEVGEGKIKRRSFDGSISISSLNRKVVLNSLVSDGYIAAFHRHTSVRDQGTNPVYPVNLMPEVVVVAYVHTGVNVNFSTWLWLNSFFYNNDNTGVSTISNGDSGNYFGSLDGSGYYFGGSGGSNYGDSAEGGIDATISVDADGYADHEGIDVENYLKCFDGISDVGAQCEIRIYADIPVDSDPNKIFDFSTGSPGHTFIGIKKTNGLQSVHQYIGFYPKTGWKSAITNAPTDAKFVDDSQHEYNASYSKSLTPDEFKSVLTEIRYLKNVQYDIDNFNCTDWALAIFNKQGYGLQIPLYDIPGNLPSTGTSMPQGVYNKLKEMKANNSLHADQISLGFSKGYAANSSGPCQ